MTRYGCLILSSDQARGTALVPALSILLFLAIVFMAVLSFSVVRYSTHVRSRNLVAARYLAESGISRILSQESFAPGDSVIMDDFPTGGSCFVRCRAWGPVYLLASEGRRANQHAHVYALVGTASDNVAEAAFVIGEERYPVTVAGSAQIIGDVRTGLNGVISGRFEGRDPECAAFHVGRILPAAPTEFFTQDSLLEVAAHQLFDHYRAKALRRLHGQQVWQGSGGAAFPAGQAVLVSGNVEIFDCVPPKSPRLTTIVVDGSVTIGGQTALTDLTEIVASGQIVVGDQAAVHNVLLFSRDTLTVTGHASFSGVAHSQTAALILDSASCMYPTIVSVSAEHSSGGSPLRVASAGSLQATFLLAASGPQSNSRTIMRLIIDTPSVVVGAVLTTGAAEIRGDVHGLVMAEQLMREAAQTTYVNWLVDATVDRTKLEGYPALPYNIDARAGRTRRILWKEYR